MRSTVFVFLALAGVTFLRAHPEIEGALARLNAAIAATPSDASLFLERGELYAKHADWVSAEANYLVAAELAPQDPDLARARGALALATGHPTEARRHLDDALRRQPADASSLVLRARTHAALHDRRSAVADFTAALALVSAPSPELYLERAALLDAPAAIRSLDEGLTRIGPAFAMQLRALALEESLDRTDEAVARLDRIAAHSERKEIWLKRRGDLLLRTGRASEARAAYAAALDAIATLPDWLRESPESARLSAELLRLSSPSS